MKALTAALVCVMLTGLTASSAPASASKADSLSKKPALAPKADSTAQKQASAPAADTSKSAHFGRIAIVTVPAGAEVSLDSVQKGQGPLTLDSLAPGTHSLIVRAAGYFGKKVSVDVPADSTVSLNVTLVLPAHLVVVSEPSGAAAFLDDKELGVTPCDNPRVKPGDHTIKLDKAGYTPFEKHVSLTEGKADTLSATLKPVAPQKAAAAPKTKGFNRIAALIAVGAFVVFSVIILAVEMNEAAH
jgi:PEGA domain